MAMDKSKNLFYQGTNLNTILNKSNQNIAIFRNAELPLAQLHTQSSAKILGSDIQNTPISLLSETGVTPLAYSPYGSSSTTNHELSVLGFTGQPSLMPGLYLLGSYRLLCTDLMRLNAYDSLSPFTILNGYGYGDGDPVNTIDPTGHKPWGIFGRAAGALSRNWGRFKNYVGLGGRNRTAAQAASGPNRNPQAKAFTEDKLKESSALFDPDVGKSNPLFIDSGSIPDSEHIYEVIPPVNQSTPNRPRTRDLASAPKGKTKPTQSYKTRIMYEDYYGSGFEAWDTSTLNNNMRKTRTNYNAWSAVTKH